jgi:predicted ferric reductase
VALNAIVIVGMWVRHGGADGLTSATAQLTAAGQLTALLGTYAALVQIVLMTRSPWLEQLYGMDTLAHWHRWLGFGCTIAISAHVGFTTAGYALGDGRSFVAETWTLNGTYPYVLIASIGTVFLIMVAVTSLRLARRRVRYETWHFIHLFAYLAIALSFGHVLAVGTDFSKDPVARGYWIALYAVVVALILLFRLGQPIKLALRHRFRVAKVVPEAPGVASVYVIGRNLDQLRARAGQYFTWRFFAGNGMWRAHPFSLSAAPNGEYLRLTVKRVGDGSADVHRLQPGTRVAVEGPYGLFTTLRRTHPRTLLIAGGIGITPVRALLEELPAGKGNTIVLYRVSSWDYVVFRAELDELAKARQATVYYMVGQRGTGELAEDPLSPRALRRLVPDLVQREVFICGPGGMMLELHRSLRDIGVPEMQIHYERFALL